jgi:hypothetical protein
MNLKWRNFFSEFFSNFISFEFASEKNVAQKKQIQQNKTFD